MTGASRIDVAIVADIRLYREGLARSLEDVGIFRVAATTASADELLAACAHAPPDIVLIDLMLPDGLAAIARVAGAFPEARVVALAVPETEHAVIACAEAGIAGYVAREASLDEAARIIEAVAHGEMPVPPRISASLLRRVATLSAGYGRIPRATLTEREREVVGLIEQGLSNKQIAERLRIQLPTVKNHVHRVLEKLEVGSRREAVSILRARVPPFALERPGTPLA